MDLKHLVHLGLPLVESCLVVEAQPSNNGESSRSCGHAQANKKIMTKPSDRSALLGISTRNLKKIEPAVMEVLRHHHMNDKPLPGDVCPIRSDGFCAIEDILKLPTLQKLECTFEALRDVVQNSSKTRAVIQQLEPDGPWFIRANQGHTIKHIDEAQLGLSPIHLDGELPVACIHGTYLRVWPLICKNGLSSMTRNHVHFASSLDAKSGKRKDCDIAIYLNLPLALKHGLQFFLSANGVILTPGLDGIVAPEFFERAICLKNGIPDPDTAPLWPLCAAEN